MARRSARTWLLEVSLAVLAMLLGLFFVWQSVGEGDGAPLPLEAAAGALSFAGLVLFRRSHPVGLTLALIPAGILLGMPMGATPIALFSVALHRPARVTIAVASLHAAGVATIYGLVLGLTRTYYESVAFVVLLHVSVVAVAMVIRAHRQLVASWAERARQAEEGQRLRIDQARLAERERIAREMHDVLAHRVSLLALHAGALEVRRDATPDEKQAAGVIRQSAYDALEDLRMLLGMLRAPAEDRPQPTLDDVPALVERSRLAGADITFAQTRAQEEPEEEEEEDEEEAEEDDGVPAQTGRHAYRIIQEALTNALKHAPGAPVRVNVDIVWLRGLDVRVDNDLRWEHDNTISSRLAAAPEPTPGAERIPGVERIPGAGAGLAGLQERVQLVGGRLEHGPTPSGEFNLRAWLPWQT
jgi:signal transduction histidine kinase